MAHVEFVNKQAAPAQHNTPGGTMPVEMEALSERVIEGPHRGICVLISKDLQLA